MIQPTCKAVTRPGQRGARIHPKGCKVRYKVQADRSIRKVAKATPGVLKPVKHKVYEYNGTQANFMIRYTRQHPGNRRNFLWDTGATWTTADVAGWKAMGVLTPNGEPRAPLQWGASKRIVIADGTESNVRHIPRVPLAIMQTGESVSGGVLVMPAGASYLLGVSHIGKVKTLKVKFK